MCKKNRTQWLWMVNYNPELRWRGRRREIFFLQTAITKIGVFRRAATVWTAWMNPTHFSTILSGLTSSLHKTQSHEDPYPTNYAGQTGFWNSPTSKVQLLFTCPFTLNSTIPILSHCFLNDCVAFQKIKLRVKPRNLKKKMVDQKTKTTAFSKSVYLTVKPNQANNERRRRG